MGNVIRITRRCTLITRTGVGVFVCWVRMSIMSLVACKCNSFLLSHFGLLRDKFGFGLYHILSLKWGGNKYVIWTASSEFGTYHLCEQRRFRRACASAQSRQNLRCSLIQAVSQEDPSDRKPDPWSLWMAGHAQLKFLMTECSKTQIRLTGLIYIW